MKFQRYINQHTNQITLITAILIGVGLLGKVVDSDMVYTVSFIAASIISAVPIVLRAVSALRFKTISIELLVSIAVIGAFIIGEYNESAIVTFLFLFGTFLEDKTLAKTRHSIKDLTEMAPTTAMIVDDDGNTEETDVDFVDVDDPGAVRAAETVVGQLLFQGFQGHKRHKRLPVGLVDDDVVAVGLDIQDVVQGDFGHHEVHLDGDGVGGWGGFAAAEGVDLAFQAVDVPPEPLVALLRLPVLERSETPLVRQRDGQRDEHHQESQDGNENSLGNDRPGIQDAGNGDSFADGRSPGKVQDQDLEHGTRQEKRQVPGGKGADPPLDEEPVDEPQAVRQVDARVHQED